MGKRADRTSRRPQQQAGEELRDLVAAWRDPNSLSNRTYAITDPANIDFDSPEVQGAETPRPTASARPTRWPACTPR
jgi:hypothetical protein